MFQLSGFFCNAGYLSNGAEYESTQKAPLENLARGGSDAAPDLLSSL